MEPRILGEHPLATDPAGKLRSRIGTIFPRRKTIVTLPGIHATQRLAFLDVLAAERVKAGEAPMTRDEQLTEWEASVDLIFEEGVVLIRPNPDEMTLAFEADDVLQEIVPKHRIKFLNLDDQRVRGAIQRRGECWRIAMLPRSVPEMIHMIEASKVSVGGRDLYYYDRLTGTHFLTFQEFSALADLDDAGLAAHLVEIRDLSTRYNRLGSPELRFFMADDRFGTADLRPRRFEQLDPAALREQYAAIRTRFEAAVSPEFRQDDPDNTLWRSRMYAALIGQPDKAVSEEMLLGLSSEFFMQIQWLPGCRISEGELLFDPILEDGPTPREPELESLCDEKCRSIIFNFVRELGDLEHINIGRIVGSMSRRGTFYGRRNVYVAVVKLKDAEQPIVNLIRLQKWGVGEHLDEGKSLTDAMIQADEYTDYIFDRRLGCRQLGMNLPPRVTARRLAETYWGRRPEYRGRTIWTTYFQRDYLRGIASDKIPECRFASPEFAMAFARLLGRAAAPNLIVGRCDLDGNVLFDDGDEVVIEDADGVPSEIVVADQTGTFVDYVRELEELAADYARPILRRIGRVADPKAFAAAYVDAFEWHFAAIQGEYAKRRRAFDTLFQHQRRDEGGSFAYRWERVLARLERADVHSLRGVIERKLEKS